MKIAYYSILHFTDSDFPLIREMQRKGLDITYFIDIDCYALKAALFNIKKQYPRNGIFPASIYPEFKEYGNYIDISKIYVINRIHKSAFHPLTIFLYIKLLIFLIKEKFDILHTTYPYTRSKLILHLFWKKKVLTVHDPFLHSGKENKEIEIYRKIAFKRADRLILLNNKETNKFCKLYKIQKEHISQTRFGEFSYMRHITPNYIIESDKEFILFFGYIASYKGLEYLLDSINVIHNMFPDINLVIAGGGNMYVNPSLYENKEYIHIYNRYITMSELSGLLKRCLFSVCPYKDATQSGVVQTAFSTGTPLIVTNVGALSEAVINGVTGLVVPPCNVESLTMAIKHLLLDRNLLNVFRKNIETKWREGMSWSPIVDEYIKCYRAL